MGAQKPENKITTAERRRFVIERRQAGDTYEQIARKAEAEFGADQMPGGWDRRYAAKDLRRALENLETDLDAAADEMLQLELERLNTAQRSLWAKVLRGEETAIDRLLKIMERRAKYLGLDEPEEIRTQMDVSAESLIPQLMEALRAFPEARQAVAEKIAGQRPTDIEV
jgi:hypothetical protein